MSLRGITLRSLFKSNINANIPWISGTCFWYWSSFEQYITKANLFSSRALCSSSISLLENKFSEPDWLIDANLAEIKKIILEIYIFPHDIKLSIWFLFIPINSLNVVLSCVIKLSTVDRQCCRLGKSIWKNCESKSSSMPSFFHDFLVYWYPDKEASNLKWEKIW